jgi:hypothetical protein
MLRSAVTAWRCAIVRQSRLPATGMQTIPPRPPWCVMRAASPRRDRRAPDVSGEPRMVILGSIAQQSIAQRKAGWPRRRSGVGVASATGGPTLPRHSAGDPQAELRGSSRNKRRATGVSPLTAAASGRSPPGPGQQADACRSPGTTRSTLGLGRTRGAGGCGRPRFPAKNRLKKMRNIPYWVENDVLSHPAVDPGCRRLSAGGLRWPLLSGSRPAGVRFESQLQTTGRDLESRRQGSGLSVSGRPAQFFRSQESGVRGQGSGVRWRAWGVSPMTSGQQSENRSTYQ